MAAIRIYRGLRRRGLVPRALDDLLRQGRNRLANLNYPQFSVDDINELRSAVGDMKRILAKQKHDLEQLRSRVGGLEVQSDSSLNEYVGWREGSRAGNVE
jgi:hypothetical protein